MNTRTFNTLLFAALFVTPVFGFVPQPAATPEPATLVLVGAGIAGVFYIKLRRSKNK
jgi:hypothetical protein